MKSKTKTPAEPWGVKDARKILKKCVSETDRARARLAEVLRQWKIKCEAEKKQAAIFAKFKKTGKVLKTHPTGIVPPKGVAFIAYKGVYIRSKDAANYFPPIPAVLQLLIPANADRQQHGGAKSKCRASSAKVLKVLIAKGPYGTRFTFNPELDKICSSHDRDYTYTVGKLHKPRYAYTKRLETCASGIHFYLTVPPAKEHVGL